MTLILEDEFGHSFNATQMGELLTLFFDLTHERLIHFFIFRKTIEKIFFRKNFLEIFFLEKKFLRKNF